MEGREYEELNFNDEHEYDDSVPVADRGRHWEVDDTVPVPDETADSPYRTCPICNTTVDLRKTEIGLLDEWGDCVFFCSQEHKAAWNPRVPSTVNTNGKQYKPGDHERDDKFYGRDE